jgi:hypothetical protein
VYFKAVVAIGLALFAAGCTSDVDSGPGASDAVDTLAIKVNEYRIPRDAAVGQWVRYRLTGQDIDERTIAVVDADDRGLWTEYTERAAGRAPVVTRVCTRDGEPVAAFRGPQGGPSHELEVLPSDSERILKDAQERAKNQSAAHGLKDGDVSSSQSNTHEVITVPAGTFRCSKTELTGQVLWVHSRLAHWSSAQVPLWGLVQSIDDDGVMTRRTTVLVAFGLGEGPLRQAP